MISALQWIARGKSLAHPKKYVLDDDEMERVSKMANVQFEDAKAQLERAQRDIARGKDPFAPNTGAGDDEDWQDDDEDDDEMKEDQDGDAAMADDKKQDKEDPDDLSRYNLDEYDDDDEPQAQATAGAFSNIRGLAVYQSNEDDPYVTVQDDAEKDDEEEREELEVYPTDNFIITAKTEDDVSQLEAHIYAAQDANLYVHHDLMLPSFPLCLEWLDYTPARNSSGDQNTSNPPGAVGNYIAVGTMDPEIEIWSMDVVDGMYPDAILGRKGETDQLNAPLGTGKKKRKQSKARVANEAYHVDAVLSLSWNPVARNLLASASADCTVKLWDLSRPHSSEASTAFRSFGAHTDKVQSVAWQCKAVGGDAGAAAGANPAVLLTGSYDKTVRIFDTRTPDTAAVVRIGSDVESVVWNGWSPACSSFLCSLESGIVQSFDLRSPTSAQWTLQAHDAAATAVDISPHIPGAILTASSDRSVKLWSLSHSPESAAPGAINLVLTRDLGLGKIFTAKFSPDDPLTLAAAGSAGQVHVFNALSNPAVRKTFGDRLRALKGDARVVLDGTEPSRGDGIVWIQDDDEDEDDDDDGDDMRD
ncbi:related to WD repeat protein PWP1 [Sporisorium reilianum SRZ2]|uniref:Related to WD repeat protein PWP1 n=1 Tax=Sporisorium reilianum (strain SRZ2) TaxID=999809 RepID=E6ZK41_SPORE|nr:related to WD repeat protein PWP1 [Sporisorium reilianum SRZ2]